jgi:hypothetical protein
MCAAHLLLATVVCQSAVGNTRKLMVRFTCVSSDEHHISLRLLSTACVFAAYFMSSITTRACHNYAYTVKEETIAA